jgi:hypothetical protein
MAIADDLPVEAVKTKSPDEFVKVYGPIAEKVGKEIGVDPKLILGKWGMETGWGKSVIGDYNLGNVKDPSGEGKRAHDKVEGSNDAYLSFGSPNDWATYYTNFIKRGYPNAVGAGSDAQKFTEGLNQGVNGSYFGKKPPEEYLSALSGSTKTASRFFEPTVDTSDDSETEAERMKREGKFIDPNASSSEGAKEETALERAKRIYQENKDNLAVPAAAAGAAKGFAEKVLTNPSANMMAAGETTADEVRVLQQRARNAEIRAQEIGDEIEVRRSNGASVRELEIEYQVQQEMANRADQELRAATEEARRLNKAPAPTASPVTETAEEIASRTKAGASGASNWVRAMGEDVPDVLADQAANMRKDNPKGGQAIIDRDLVAKQKIADIGAGDFKLATTEGGVQLQLPPQETARLDAELAKKQEVERVAQKSAAEQAEAQRLAQEQQLAQQRQAAQQRVERARQQKIAASQQTKAAQQQANAERTQAAAEARRATTADTTARAASRTAQEAAEAQPSALKMMAREAGRRFSEKLPVIGNTLSAAGATLSVNEAIERYKEGDYSGSVLGTIEAALNTASMAPPTSPASLAVKGVGTIGSLGMIPVWIAHDYIKGVGPWAQKKQNPPQKARGGLTLMR